MARAIAKDKVTRPTPDDRAAVRTALTKAGKSLRINLADLPDDAAVLVCRLLEDYAAGRRPRVIPDDAEISTFQAADLLNVSRPYLVGLLDEGAIRFHMVGSHRRMKLTDVLSYKETKDRTADAAMDELVTEAQKLKLGY